MSKANFINSKIHLTLLNHSLYPHLSVFRPLACDKHGEGCFADISTFLIGNVHIHDTGCATLMDAFSFNGQYIVEFSCFKVVDRGLECHSIKPQRDNHQTTDLVTKGEEIASMGIAIVVERRVHYFCRHHNMTVSHFFYFVIFKGRYSVKMKIFHRFLLIVQTTL